MHWSLNHLRGFSLGATDGALGKVEDVYFHDDTWLARYLVADTRRWLFGRTVLIAPAAVGEPKAATREVPVALTKDQVRESPATEADRPISRTHEQDLARHYGWPTYWSVGYSGLAMPALTDAPPIDAAAPAGDVAAGDTAAPVHPPQDQHLRSAREIEGYAVAACDGEVGTVHDFILNTADRWSIPFVEVDTGTWLPGRKVVLSPAWITEIDHMGRTVRFDLSKDEIESSPTYEPRHTVGDIYIAEVLGHYGRDQ